VNLYGPLCPINTLLTMMINTDDATLKNQANRFPAILLGGGADIFGRTWLLLVPGTRGRCHIHTEARAHATDSP
jgi:hypothetical protein